MSLILGISGATRNTALAVLNGGRIVAVCEHEQVTRTRRAALRDGQVPKETLATVLKVAGRIETEVAVIAAAERAIQLTGTSPVEYVDHHQGHAATAFY